MNRVFRNFFYAVGIVALAFLYSIDPSAFTFGDVARLVQSHNCQHIVCVLTMVLFALDLVLGAGYGFSANRSFAAASKWPAEESQRSNR